MSSIQSLTDWIVTRALQMRISYIEEGTDIKQTLCGSKVHVKVDLAFDNHYLINDTIYNLQNIM